MNSTNGTPMIYGTGFVPLDVVVDQDSGTESLYAGGTCGNVLAILSLLGWRATPIGRLAQDYAGALVREDLEEWNVDTSLLGLDPQSATPIVIEEIYRNRSGEARHRYLWTCPDCGGYLPHHKPLLSRSVEPLLSLPTPQVFFFDRVSRSALALAEHFSAHGTLIVFEPSGSSDPKLFKEAIAIAHILKYSSQRVRAFNDLLKGSRALLEIETLGDEGLRYRTNLHFSKRGAWSHLASYQVDTIRDTAGCGDWCTAGLLYRIGARGLQSLAVTSPESLRDALHYAQAFSAWNCRFPGARGGMYLMGREAMLKAVQRIVSGSIVPASRSQSQRNRPKKSSALFCSACGDSAGTSRVLSSKLIRSAG